MLQIKNISKQYKTGDLIQTALNDVSLNLRDNEFVSILGPSGSGKTTLLNIIGGLDRYDSGDLIINNVSTKNYKDRDWDTYRNHTIGFVFQSYNLIPHQTVLSNVELALTISGISKKQRRQKALDALEQVGLKEQAHKKPNQMSGGQMQRVAIARALVNNPDIVLADEPTGALDTKTSVQVMDLLKQVAKDRLVVMVTHNPELAEQYSNRIIRLQDGVIISDSNPYVVDNNTQDTKPTKSKKAHMSILTALSLSFNNLLTKKGRTILTAFAGSIGIIGIALILSLSQGFQNYIDKIQEDTLSSYPLTITSETADATSAILSMVSDNQNNKVDGENIIERQYLTKMFSSIGTNDLKSFKKYIEENQDEVNKYTDEIRYSYSIVPQIYTIDAANNLAKLNPSSILSSMYSSSSLSLMSSLSAGSGGVFSEMGDDVDSLKEQYTLLKGKWPTNYDEIIIVLSEPNSISDLLVYSLGLRDTAELKTIITDVMTGEDVEVENTPLKLTYDDLLNVELKLVKATDTYKYNEKYKIYEDMSEDDEYMRKVYDNSLRLKVVGIVCQAEGGSSTALSAGVSYTKDLTQHVIDSAENTPIVKSQIKNKDVDVFSGKSFDDVNEDDKEKSKLDFQDMISVDEDMIKDAFKINISEDDFKDVVSQDDIEKIVTDVVTNSSMAVASEAQNLFILNTMCLNYYVKYYDDTYGITGTLDLSQLSTVHNNFIDGYHYKDVVQNQLSSILSPEIIAVTNTLSDADYELLAADIKSMFLDYYAFVDNDDYKEGGDLKVFLNPDPSNKFTIYGNTSTAKQISSLTLVPMIANPMAMTNTISVVNIKGSTVISMVAGASATSAANAAATVAKGMGSLFGEDMMSVDTKKFSEAFKFNMNQDELSRIMSTMMSSAQEKTYTNNLISLGYQDVDDPTNISFYFKDFESKENFLKFVDKYNEGKDEDAKLKYTDITGILMSSVKTIVDSVTYVLIAFVSISLIVSSIMIAVITLISVMERTKEIGILRAMGASKRNVSSIFNAETFIIGLLSGSLGIGITYLLIVPINTIIHVLTNNNDINAILPTKYAIILILISVILTIMAGVIPSKKAAKQDPVIALRSE